MDANIKDTLVMKFGGASVAKPEQFDLVAKIIEDRKGDWNRIAVVVSAMHGMTDSLIDLANQVNRNASRREMDMLLSVGERISISLLAMALEKRNIRAVSFTGSQSGILTSNKHTDALISDVRPVRLWNHLDQGAVVIVAGFQGVCADNKEITTLGRGGSDTSAVALAAALNADHVEFFKDVPGVFDSDPKKNPNATLFSKMSFSEAIKLMESGAKVLHSRAVKLAEKNQIPLEIYSFNDYQVCGTRIGEVSGISIENKIDKFLKNQQKCRVPVYEVSQSITCS
jgi:aspartate kinase